MQLLMTVALAALAVGSLSLWGILHLLRRTGRLSAKTEREAVSGADENRDGRAAQETAARAAGEKRAEAHGQTTTMEEEISQLRAAASVVGDMVTAEEGRARRRQQQQQQQQAPSYTSVVETHDADDSVSDSSSSAGGFRYTPVSGSEHSQQGDDRRGRSE
ncbi:Uncharacterized protein TPAR_05144 [Tolypocladium paradoxum]|uniref:Uncharacterized protein n=1 Tax=Tolypocladium paradoxum TaxID=94208 RepID=A0A2S4KWU8_9HYPO|nr:Uncharacterized protein TPAR_05144 [Tolypocladium paradoxum]